MQKCPYCGTFNRHDYKVCARCKKTSPWYEQKIRYSRMLLPPKVKMKFVPAKRPTEKQMKTPGKIPPKKSSEKTKFEKKVEDVKTYEEALKMAERYYKEGVYDKSTIYFKKALSMRDNDPEVWLTYSVALRCMRKVDEALAAIDKAIAIDPKNVNAWRRKGFTFRILGRTQEAIKCYDRILQINPRDTNAMLDKANALEDLKMYAEALTIYNKVLEVDPKDRFAREYKEVVEKLLKKKRMESYRKSFFPSTRTF